jgi:hypothetical protein
MYINRMLLAYNGLTALICRYHKDFSALKRVYFLGVFWSIFSFTIQSSHAESHCHCHTLRSALQGINLVDILLLKMFII